MTGDPVSRIWDVTPNEAVGLQGELRKQVRIEPFCRPVRYIAGCDVAYEKGAPIAYAGIVVLSLPSLEVVDRASEVE
jgi:deoxyribonuclease V